MRHLTLQILSSLALLTVTTAGATIWWQTAHGTRLLSVQSNSMLPRFARGDAVLVKPAAIRVGHVLSYRLQSNPHVVISHRLIATTPNGLLFKGDNLARPDDPVARGQVIGEVVAVWPGWGRVVMWLHQPVGLVTLVYVPLSMLMAAEILLVMQLRHVHYRLRTVQ